MKKLIICSVAVLVSLVWSGCASTPEPAPEQTDTAIRYQQHSAAILDAFMQADYKKLRPLLSENIATEFPQEKFDSSIKQLQNTLGKIKSYAYLTELKVPVLHTDVYKVTFERIGNQKQKITQEALFRITMAEDQGKIMVLSFNFF